MGCGVIEAYETAPQQAHAYTDHLTGTEVPVLSGRRNQQIAKRLHRVSSGDSSRLIPALTYIISNIKEDPKKRKIASLIKILPEKHTRENVRSALTWQPALTLRSYLI
jgi:hypothetical protein